jgi:hypothetical protein
VGEVRDAVRSAPKAPAAVPFRRLDAAEREAWDRDGFTLLRGAVNAATVERTLDAVDRLAALHGDPHLTSGTAFERVNVVEEDDAFLDLVDHPALLGAALDLMGAAIQLLVSTVTLRPPSPYPAIRWHTDDPSPYFFPRAGGQVPVWQLKCAVYLTDVDDVDMGNFVAAPGSHLAGMPRPLPGLEPVLTKSRYRELPDVAAAVPGARQVMARAGDVLLFHPALWHTVAPNRSARVRKNVWYVYGPLWMRLGDRVASDPALVARCDDVRRQLLGATVGAHRSSLAPGDDGAPLVRLWEGETYDATWRRHLDALLDEWWGPGRPDIDGEAGP